MRDFDRSEIDEPSVQTETEIDLPSVPRDVEDLKVDKNIEIL